MLDYIMDGPVIRIETDHLQAEIHTEGYVSGVAAGTLLDKKTGARDLGFGLSIVDFLLEEGQDDPDAPHAYHWGDRVHGNIPKRYVELPQICTQARKLPFEVTKSQRSITVRQWFNWTIATRNRKPGSLWEQILVFPADTRYFFSADRVTSVNTVDNLALRVDMPGHLKHNRGDSFSQIYLSYHGTIPNTEFLEDFPPDARFRYVRGSDPLPERMIRAYQTSEGPWLAGMTLNPEDVSDAWCHQRGYVCFIQEIGREKVRAGEKFSAAYIIGFFDSIKEMEEACDRHHGWSDVILEPSLGEAQTSSQWMVSPRLICSADSSIPARSSLSDIISAVSFQHSITSCTSDQFPLDKASSTAFCSSSLNSSLSQSAKQSIQEFCLPIIL